MPGSPGSLLPVMPLKSSQTLPVIMLIGRLQSVPPPNDACSQCWTVTPGVSSGTTVNAELPSHFKIDRPDEGAAYADLGYSRVTRTPHEPPAAAVKSESGALTTRPPEKSTP